MGFKAYIGVGANLEPESSILRALELLQTQVQVTACSSFYRTAALGRTDQPAYYNGIWQIVTSLKPRILKFEVLRGIEAQLGRRREADRYAARKIDLDLLLFGQQVIKCDDFCLPDPDIYTRNFIAIPLGELEPGLIIPGSRQPLAEVIARMDCVDIELLPGFTSLLQDRVVRGFV